MVELTDREKKAKRIARLREKGLEWKVIAKRMRLSTGYVKNIYYDPDGSMDRARKMRHRTECIRCGDPTYGDLCHPCKVGKPKPVPVVKEKRRCDTCQGPMSMYNTGTTCNPCEHTRSRLAFERLQAPQTVESRREIIVSLLEQRPMSIPMLLAEVRMVEKTLREDVFRLIEQGRVETGSRLMGHRYYRAVVDGQSLMGGKAA